MTKATRVAVGAGALTMVALCFANGLQQGIDQSQSQAIESLKASFHVTDFEIGLIRVSTGTAGALGALGVARLCRDRARTKVLGAMFATWSLLMFVTGFVSVFPLFVVMRTLAAPTEATDPAAMPLIADWWPVSQRAGKVSVFQAGAGVGALLGIIGAGVLVDAYGWQAAFWMWVPMGLLGSVLIRAQREPRRGVQDVRFRSTVAQLEATTLEEHELAAARAPRAEPKEGTAAWKEVFALRTWRNAAIGMGVAQMFLTGLTVWGPSYFKRTFGLTGAQVAGLTPLVGAGAFLGLIGGGFIADRLLQRGVLKARVYVTAWSFAAGGVVLALAFLTTTLWVAVPLLFVGTAITALPSGPSYALLLDVTPYSLRERAAGISNVVLAVSLLGSPIVGGLSTLFGDNLRVALLCVTPLYVVGAALVSLCLRTYGDDLAMVVAEAEVGVRDA